MRNTRSQPRDLNDLFQNCHTTTTINQSGCNRGVSANQGTGFSHVMNNSTNQRADAISRYNLDSTYQEIASPKNLDPFGTLRGSKLRRSLKEKSPPTASERIYVNDPF